MNLSARTRMFEALETFRIEIPSWGFANTGTRFGKFLQPATASSTQEKFSDAAEGHRETGICPATALHVLWDFAEGIGSLQQLAAGSARYGIQAGSINPNVFEDQIYKHGSLFNPDASVRSRALEHIKESVEIARGLNSHNVSLWFADESSDPGSADIRHPIRAESLLQDAFQTDVCPAIQDWRDSKGLAREPLEAFRESGYLERITKERSARSSQSVPSYA